MSQLQIGVKEKEEEEQEEQEEEEERRERSESKNFYIPKLSICLRGLENSGLSMHFPKLGSSRIIMGKFESLFKQ